MTQVQRQTTVRGLLAQENVKVRFQEILKDRAASFTANLAVIVNNNAALSKCEPMSIISSSIIAASLNLPLDPNLGFAAIVPYGDKAQFQMMYKGYLQLAMRTGQYENIGVTEIYETQLKKSNPLTGMYEFDFDADIRGKKVVGYAAYFKLINGFEKTIYRTVESIDAHGKRYSKTYAKNFGVWKDDFESMAKKTVLKELIRNWGILSIEMQQLSDAVKYDQSMVTEDLEPVYVDNEENVVIDISEAKAENATLIDEKPKAGKKENLFDNKE